MKKELFKGFAMLILLVAIAFATAVVSNAQSTSRLVSAIPFEFVAGNQSMPAGEYVFSKDATPGLTVRNSEAEIAAILMTQAIETEKNETSARLVFHRYGERYFLAEVWDGNRETGVQLVKSRQERAIESELASIPSKSDWALGHYEIVELVAVHR